MDSLVLWSLLIGGLLVIVFVLFTHSRRQQQQASSTASPTGAVEEEDSEEERHKKKHHKKGGGKKQPFKSGTAVQKFAAGKGITEHPRLAVVLKGHQNTVTCGKISVNGQIAITGDQDRTLRIWSLESGTHVWFNARDYPQACDISSDSKVAVFALRNSMQFYEIGTSKGKFNAKLAREFDISHCPFEISTCMLFASARCIVTYAVPEDKSTEVWIWSLKGECVSKFKTDRLQNFQGSRSLNEAFFTIGTRFPNVGVWEITGNAENSSFQRVEKVMSLNKHKKMVKTVSFDSSSEDSLRVVSISDEGLGIVWDLNVRYKIREDPKILREFEVKECPTAVAFHDPFVATAQGCTLRFIDSRSGEVVEEIENAHSDPIAALNFSKDGNRIFTCGDRLAKIWDAPTK